MRANELYNTRSMLYVNPLTTESDVIAYMKRRDVVLREYVDIEHEYTRNWRRSSLSAILLTESLASAQNTFLTKFMSFDEYNKLKIKIGMQVSILNAEISGDRFDIWGFVEPKIITDIIYTDDATISQFEFNNDPGDRWPRVENAQYNGKFISHSIFFGNTIRASRALTTLLLSKPEGIEIKTHLMDKT